MTAHEQMRQMLDQLMGTGRDGENNRYKVKFSDPRVCKSFLLGCCPHDILASTRMDLGDCARIHDLALRADYEQAATQKDYSYDIDAMEHLQAFIGDCDKRTEQAKKRLAETQEELSAEVATKANRVHELAENIGKKLAKAEQLGADGNVEDSLKAMEDVEEIRKKKSSAEQDYRNSMPASSYQQQKLRVCEVCSAYLGIHDNDRRLADHFGGKLHLGFIKIRERLDDLRKMVAERREKQRAERPAGDVDGRTEERRPDRDFGRGRDSRDRGGDRHQSDRYSRQNRARSRSGSRSRLDRRNRSRSRERGGQSRQSHRSRDRNYRSSQERSSRYRGSDYSERRRGRSRSRERERERDRGYQRGHDERRRDRSNSRDRRQSDEDSRSSKTRDDFRETGEEVEPTHFERREDEREGGEGENVERNGGSDEEST